MDSDYAKAIELASTLRIPDDKWSDFIERKSLEFRDERLRREEKEEKLRLEMKEREEREREREDRLRLEERTREDEIRRQNFELEMKRIELETESSNGSEINGMDQEYITNDQSIVNEEITSMYENNFRMYDGNYCNRINEDMKLENMQDYEDAFITHDTNVEIEVPAMYNGLI